MTEMEIVAAVRSVAAELSCRGSTPGQIGAGTRHRIRTLFNEPKPLIAWFNRELETTASGQRLPTATGEIVKAIISHLTASLGAKCKTALDQEQAIVQAATQLPVLCDRLVPPATSSTAAIAPSPNKPTDLERNTYYVYTAVEAYLMEKHDVSKVGQTEIHRMAKALIDNEIDRGEHGIDESYVLQPKFDAFIKAYRRARDLLSAS